MNVVARSRHHLVRRRDRRAHGGRRGRRQREEEHGARRCDQGEARRQGKVSTTQYSLSPGVRAAGPRQRGAAEDHRLHRQQPGAGRAARREVVGTMIDAATAAGANRAADLQFTLEERAEAQSNALAKPGADAKRQAEATAAALGVELGGCCRRARAAGRSSIPRPSRAAGWWRWRRPRRTRSKRATSTSPSPCRSHTRSS